VDVLWSKGVALHCDHAWGPDYWRLPTERRCSPAYFAQHWQGCAGTAFVRLGTPRHPADESLDLSAFAANLERLVQPVTLLTCDGDCSVPGDLPEQTVRRILEHPLVLGWHTQNWDGFRDAKLHPFPIGMQFHTRKQCGPALGRPVYDLLRRVAHDALPLSQRPLTIFCDAHLTSKSRYGVERQRARERLAGCAHVQFLPRRVGFPDILKAYASCAFVLSPPGNGLDCHRTWEALFLGSIVIARRSPLDCLYQELAVALVDDWDECRDPHRLRRWRDELGPRCADAPRRLRLQAWLPSSRSLREREPLS
jgi:hypothetical protein